MQTMTSTQFNKNRRQAKQAACDGPVVITSRGKAAYVFMRYEDYITITSRKNLAQLLAQND